LAPLVLWAQLVLLVQPVLQELLDKQEQQAQIQLLLGQQVQLEQ
jgi:hypothetical protein